MSEGIPELETLHEDIWSMLETAVADRSHAMHAPAVANCGASGPEVRTVVLRGVNGDERTMFFHTDGRAPKIADLEEDPRVQWLCYDPGARIQLRITAEATIHRDDALADTDWAEAPLASRRCYLSEFAPGTPLDVPASGIPEQLEARRPTVAETVPGRAHFAVVRCTARRIDWLLLRATGNLSATIIYDPTGGVHAHWTAP